MIRGSSDLEKVLAGPHRGVLEADAEIAGRVVARDIPLVDGSLDINRSQFVRRSGNLTFVDSTQSAIQALAATLSKPGCELRIRRGATVGTSVQTIPVHAGLVDDPTLSFPERKLTVSSPDLGMRVAYARFLSPRRSSRGLTVSQQAGVLWREILPRARFIDESLVMSAVPSVVWERDRNDAITELARVAGCETFLLPDGNPTFRPITGLRHLPVHRITWGENLLTAAITASWATVRNQVAASSSRADGANFYGKSEDLDPNSPTYVHGPLGPRSGFMASSLFTSNTQCYRAAQAARYRMQGAQVSLTVSAWMHPGIEAGDRVDVNVDGQVHRLVLDTISYGLRSGTMTASGRSARAVPAEGVE